MDLSLESAVVTLKPGAVLRLRGGIGRRVSHVRGTVWVTQDRDTRDIVLKDGADLEIEPDGAAILQALGGPAMVALEDGVKIAADPLERAAASPLAGIDFERAEREARALRAREIRTWVAAAAAALGALWKKPGTKPGPRAPILAAGS
jgi:hypothetical protein